jgi:hypothetical protein
LPLDRAKRLTNARGSGREEKIVKLKFKIRQRRAPGIGLASPGQISEAGKQDETDELTGKSLPPDAPKLEQHPLCTMLSAGQEKGFWQLLADRRKF